MFFCCYKITNLLNKKVYIGKTNRPNERWLEHQSRMTTTPISQAIKKYGSHNFSFKIIAISDKKSEIDKCEMLYITYYQSNINRYGKLFGYNLTDGGDGGIGYKITEETRKKMSESHKGILHTEESRKKIGAAHKGTHHTLESRAKMSKANIGKKWSDDAIFKISGENNNQAKLTWKLVDVIRKEYESTNITLTQLSVKYGVSYSTIQSIISNKSWRK